MIYQNKRANEPARDVKLNTYCDGTPSPSPSPSPSPQTKVPKKCDLHLLTCACLAYTAVETTTTTTTNEVIVQLDSGSADYNKQMQSRE